MDFDSTEVYFIEGDNLDALKLLQETYLSRSRWSTSIHRITREKIYIQGCFASDQIADQVASGEQVEEGARA